MINRLSLIFLHRDIQDPAYIQARFDLGVEDVGKGEIEAEFEVYQNIGAVGNIRIKRTGFSIQDIGGELLEEAHHPLRVRPFRGHATVGRSA